MKKSKRIAFDKKSKPLVSILRTHSSYQSKHPASSLKERMSPTMTSKKHVTFWTTTLEDTQANKSIYKLELLACVSSRVVFEKVTCFLDDVMVGDILSFKLLAGCLLW
jgi:hypothetical protein